MSLISENLKGKLMIFQLLMRQSIWILSQGVGGLHLTLVEEG